MLKDCPTFSGFSVNDTGAAKTFYSDKLGVVVEEDEMGLTLKLANGNNIFVYEKPDHQPATFTILNFVVEDINRTIDWLVSRDIQMERYEYMPAPQDQRGILRGLAANMGPDIAWFKDPAGNVLAVLQDK